ncbi:uncharacterized protein BYT42DRAFT_563152 [Radiomyces spectabilis]|uniref:uncharacterized protein n=1 Tax=Radiomyces spectabilis TaxID=64574 RepID=UPI00221FDD24|nr:uncharacterized protein BYT42DRAFT_563152 [Radiomyces spectabilis]KAI8384636.1 hypothetical protein BYT42DRAFT_563152 [Radiomyces spectabilis]
MTWCSAVNQLSNDKPDTIMYSRDDGYSSYRHVPNYECLPQHILDASTTGGSLSLGERRQRNKIASAKYRAKKNQQQGEMRSMIIAMSKENEVMARQLDQLCQENTRLKAMCDKLRGKMMAQKMLKQFLNHTSSAHTQANPSQADTIFEQDMDLSNSEEEEMACQL